MMNIKDSGDKRCHMTKYGIPTIQLGCGGTDISTFKLNDGISGIGFSLGEGLVGEGKPELRGKSATDANIFFQILTDNPASIQVLIDRLREAQGHLEV